MQPLLIESQFQCAKALLGDAIGSDKYDDLIARSKYIDWLFAQQRIIMHNDKTNDTSQKWLKHQALLKLYRLKRLQITNNDCLGYVALQVWRSC